MSEPMRGPMNGDPIPQNAEEALAIVHRRLLDMYEAIHGIRPIGGMIPMDSGTPESLHIAVVRLMPILADYRVLVVARKDRIRELEDELARTRTNAHDSVERALRKGREARTVVQAVRRSRTELAGLLHQLEAALLSMKEES